MNIKIQYRTDAVVLPGQVAKVIQRATKNDLRVLFAVCADRALWAVDERGWSAVAAAAGCTEAQAEASIAFWRGAGILDLEEDDEAVGKNPWF